MVMVSPAGPLPKNSGVVVKIVSPSSRLSRVIDPDLGVTVSEIWKPEVVSVASFVGSSSSADG